MPGETIPELAEPRQDRRPNSPGRDARPSPEESVWPNQERSICRTALTRVGERAKSEGIGSAESRNLIVQKQFLPELKRKLSKEGLARPSHGKGVIRHGSHSARSQSLEGLHARHRSRCSRVDKTGLAHTADYPSTAQQWSEGWACSCQAVTRYQLDCCYRDKGTGACVRQRHGNRPSQYGCRTDIVRQGLRQEAAESAGRR